VMSAQGQLGLLRIRNQLYEGVKALATRQKFIKIVCHGQILSKRFHWLQILRTRRISEGQRRRPGKMLKGKQAKRRSWPRKKGQGDCSGQIRKPEPMEKILASEAGASTSWTMLEM